VNKELHSALMTLWEFREFVQREAKVWTINGSHHNPIWQKVAEALDAHGMNACFGTPPAPVLETPERVLVWHCPMCDARVPEALADCPACVSGVAEFDPAVEEQARVRGGALDPTAKARAVSRGQASWRKGPNYGDWYCVRCDVKLVGQYEPCDHCADDQIAEPLAATMFRDLTETVACAVRSRTPKPACTPSVSCSTTTTTCRRVGSADAPPTIARDASSGRARRVRGQNGICARRAWMTPG